METIPAPRSDAQPTLVTRRQLTAAASRLHEDLSLVGVLCQKASYGDGLTPELRGVMAEACLRRVVRLVSFFYGKPSVEGRISAANFVRDVDGWEQSRPAMPAVIVTHLEQMQKLVDSNAWLEVESCKAYRCWPFSSFAMELESVMHVFEAHLSAEAATWFRAAKSDGGLPTAGSGSFSTSSGSLSSSRARRTA